ncbi:hypothetical protein HPB48_000797 [Haemaphysalis longicornis]|uniref:BTB domain-containing protein n=1 Tax=Haemaphysalis longicornis TaxID=44386 RepID=A0A9J6GJD4_HAELO|nr:hypothetical protein HPB48_000797 [Haemaphysalis longicornis]
MTTPAGRSEITSPALRSGCGLSTTSPCIQRRRDIGPRALHSLELTKLRGSAASVYHMGYSEDSKNNVVLRVGGREIRAHRSVLAVQSVVFPATFEYGMVKKTRGRAAITNLDHDVVSHMLDFYTGRHGRNGGGLIAGANNYALEAQVTVESAADLLLLADEQSESGVNAGALDIFTHAHDVMGTPG